MEITRLLEFMLRSKNTRNEQINKKRWKQIFAKHGKNKQKKKKKPE